MIKTEDYTREILTIVFAQKKIIFGVSLGITVCAVLIAFFWPPTYTVESKILIKGKKLEKSPETLEAAQLRMFELSREDLMSEMAIIVSPNVIRRTILALASDGRMFPEAGSSEEALEKIRHDIDDALTTIIIPDSNIIKVILAGRDPDKLMMLMRELGRQYTRYRAAIFNPDTALVFFSSRVDKYDSELKAQEQKLIALSYQYQSADPGKEIDNNLLLQKSLEDRLVTVQAALTDKNSHIQSVRRALGNDEIQFFSFLQVLSINQLSEKLQGLLVEKSETLRVYLDQSSKAQGLARQIQQVYAALKNEVANYLYDQAQEKAALEQQAEAIRTRLKHINARNLELHA
jgi:hypothetical protein